jgi:chemotaxis protein CheC
MQISTEKMDAIIEMVNIGFGRATASLSVLVGQRVQLEVPDVQLYVSSEVQEAMSDLSTEHFAIVRQDFTGDFNGDLLLLTDFTSAVVLIDLLSGNEPDPRQLSESDREALLEVGNILLNAYIGSVGNMLKVPITFALPICELDSFENVIERFTAEKASHIILIKTKFKLNNGSVVGYIAMVIGLSSLELMFKSLKEQGLLTENNE